MILYTTRLAPNPRRVRMFLAEKDVALETREVNLMNMEHRSESYARVNPLLAVPALALDDGAVLTESVAICRYIEFLHPEPALFSNQGEVRHFLQHDLDVDNQPRLSRVRNGSVLGRTQQRLDLAEANQLVLGEVKDFKRRVRERSCGKATRHTQGVSSAEG